MNLNDMVNTKQLLSRLDNLGGTDSNVLIGASDGDLTLNFTSHNKSGQKLGVALGITPEDLVVSSPAYLNLLKRIEACLKSMKLTLDRVMPAGSE